MISTRDLSQMPDIEGLRKLSQSLAMLDAILCPEWEGRYYSFNAHWSPGQAMASMRNGSGDEYFALFTQRGAILKGFAHESNMSPYAFDPPHIWPGVLDGVPKALAEPLFRENEHDFVEDITFCVWRIDTDDMWHRGNITFPSGVDPDGSEDLLGNLDGNPQTYQDWAESYYEHPVDLVAVSLIYEQKPLTLEIIRALNPDVSLQQLADDITEIEYPGGIHGMNV
jgi:hypothetical protein